MDFRVIPNFGESILSRSQNQYRITEIENFHQNYHISLKFLVKIVKVKLIDFGCAIEFCDNDLFTSFSGTSEFYPYEWFNSGYYCPIGGAVWSIGCLMFTLLTGTLT